MTTKRGITAVAAGITLLTLFTLCRGLTVQAGELTVSAAASLTDAFREVALHFERAHPDTTVRFNFAASGVLLQQIARGAPVDLFASADQATMDDAGQQGLIRSDSRRNFARNALVLVAPADSDLVVQRLADLATAPLQRLALGNPDYVPAGRYGRVALENAGVWSPLEGRIIPIQNVRQTLDYVVRGEVDAGVVYSTDAHLMADKLTVLTEISLQEPIRYPIAIVADSQQVTAAEHFIAHLASEKGQAILARHGFSQP